MESIQIALQLLFFMFCLFLLGEPWRIILRRFSDLFQSLDFLQILVLDIYLGGFLLYIISVIPLHLFIPLNLYIINMVSVVIVFLLHRREFGKFFQNLPLRPKKVLFLGYQSFEIVLVTLMFLFSLFVQASQFNYLSFGSVRDTSVHSLFVQVLIENGQVPTTLKPYLDEGIIYPQGFTPIAAYCTFILGYLPPQAVFYLTALFNSLAILGAYFLGKKLCVHRYLGLSLAFVFTFVASWPKYITWGSNPMVVSFPFYFVCLGFLPFLTKDKLKAKAIFAIGMLFGYLSVLHLQTYETLVAAMFILWLYIALQDKDRWDKLRDFIAISCLSLLIVSPFIYRLFTFYQYPMHNVGTPEDIAISSPQPTLSIVLYGINWLFDHLASNVQLSIASFVLFFISTLTIVCFRKRDSFTLTSKLVILGTATLLGQFLIFVLRAISPYDFIFYPHPMLLYFPFYFFIAAFTLILWRSFSCRLSQIALSEKNEPTLKKKKILVTAISLMLLLGIYSPFLYQAFVLDVGTLYGSYSIFAVTTEQDLQLILWIKENLPKNATILVNTFQSGTLIPSIAYRKVVFPFFASSTSVTYQKLVASLEENILNTTTLSLMKHFNITDIYVGSGISLWDGGIHRWNPKLFLGNPQFKLLKNFGNAYLFHCNYAETGIILLDDFEHADWNENGWGVQHYGNGIGNIAIATGFAYRSQRCLKMSAQALYTISEWKYAIYISREIFVPNNSDVNFSFYLNATEGFQGKDTFAVMISNVYHSQSMIITTPNGVYADYSNAETLSGFEGLFNYSLSASWHQFFNSSLPTILILELVNWDFDSIKNVAYVDNIKVAFTSLDCSPLKG